MKVELLSGDRLLFCGVEIYMLYRFLNSIFQRRKGQKKLFVYYFLIVFFEFCVNGFGETRLNLMVIPILYFIFAILVFQTSIGNGIAYTLIFYAIFAGGEVVYELFFRTLSKNISVYGTIWTDGGRICSLIVYYSIQFLFLLFIENIIRKLEIGNNQNFSWYLLIVPIASVTILSSFMYLNFPENLIQQSIMCIGALLLYISNATIFIILEKYTLVLNQLKNEQVYKVKRTMEDNNLQDIIRLNENYRCKMHDIHSYLGNIRILAMDKNCEEIVTLINEMEGTLHEKIDRTIYSGNSVLNAILTERSDKACAKGIEMDIFIEDFLKVDFISSADMISMFGNLIDNAIEAAEQCNEENRKISIQLFMGNQHMMVLRVENYYKTKILQEGEKLLTTKEDIGSHGLGVGIVQKLAHKYGGTLNWTKQNNVFVAILSISVKC